VTFKDCDLSGVNFSQAEFQNIDLRGSSIADTLIDIDNFREVTIDPTQVYLIANALGVSIKD